MSEGAAPPDVAAAASAWYREHGRDFLWRRPGMTPWAIYLIEVMAQQTQIERAARVALEWIERWPSPSALAATPPSEILKAWDRLGYPRRALALHRAATAMAAEHGDEVPRDLTALLALPGVGPYTAAAVASFAYGQRVPVVDTNIRRVLARAIVGVESLAPSARRDAELMDSIHRAPPAARPVRSRTPAPGAQPGIPSPTRRGAPGSRGSPAPTARPADWSWPSSGPPTARSGSTSSPSS